MEFKPRWTWSEQSSWWVGNTLVPSRIEFAADGTHGAPDVAAVFEIRDGVPEVTDFRLTAKQGGRAVRTADLNAWQPLEGLALNAFQQAAAVRRTDESGQTLGATPPIDDREKWAVRNDLQGAVDWAKSRGPVEAELAEVARIYRDAIDGRPIEAVQVRLSYGSRRTAARRVQQARSAGLLPETTPGKKNA